MFNETVFIASAAKTNGILAESPRCKEHSGIQRPIKAQKARPLLGG